MVPKRAPQVNQGHPTFRVKSRESLEAGGMGITGQKERRSHLKPHLPETCLSNRTNSVRGRGVSAVGVAVQWTPHTMTTLSGIWVFLRQATRPLESSACQAGLPKCADLCYLSL